MSDGLAILLAMAVFGGLAYACIGLVLLVAQPLAELVRVGLKRFK